MLPRTQRRRHRLRRAIVILIGTALLACAREETYEGHTMPYWAARLADRDPVVRRHAAEAMTHIAPRSPSAIHALVAALANEDDPENHVAIADALGALGPSARDAVPALIRLTHDHHEQVRREAVTALGNIGASDSSVVSTLSRALDDASHDVRGSAAEALARLGPGARGAASALGRRLDDRVTSVRLNAVRALDQIRPDASTALPMFVAALRDDGDEVRLAAAYALGRYGAAAAPAVPDLERLLDDEHFGTRTAAVVALRSIGPAAGSARGRLDRVARSDPDSTVRRMARELLDHLAGAPSSRRAPAASRGDAPHG